MSILMLVGVVTPLLGPGGEALSSDLGSAWPFLVLTAVAALATVDLARNVPSGIGAAAGVMVIPGWTLLALFRLVGGDGGLVGIDAGPGMVAWSVALLGALALLLGLRRAPGSAMARAGGWSGLVLAGSGVIWAVAVARPARGSGLSVADNLLAGDPWDDVTTLGLVLTPLAAYLAASLRRSPGLMGVAVAVSLGWLAFWAQGATSGGPLGVGLSVADDAWLPAGTIATAVAATVGLFASASASAGRRGGARGAADGPNGGGQHSPNASHQTPSAAPTTPIPLLGIGAVLAVCALTGVGLAQAGEPTGGGSALGPGSTFGAGAGWADEDGYGYDDGYDDGGYDDGGYDDGGYDGDVGAYVEGSGLEDDAAGSEMPGSDDEAPTVSSCPRDASSPSLQRYWRDDQGIHLVIVITTTCDTPQVVDDPSATFGVYAAGQPFAQASFDFSDDPVALPADGETGEIELVFDGPATVDATALSHVSLPTKEAPGRSGIDIRYRFRCRPSASESGSNSPSPLSASAGADLSMGSDQERSYPANEGDSLPVSGAASGPDALTELERIAAADQPYVEAALFDQWVPQLSSKQLGTYDEASGITYDDYGMILDLYLELKARYPSLRLLNSSTYSSFKLDSYWIVIDGDTFATPEEANAWCDVEGFGITDCYAKRINNGEYQGNTRTRE